jgi:hypothetical protein
MSVAIRENSAADGAIHGGSSQSPANTAGPVARAIGSVVPNYWKDDGATRGLACALDCNQAAVARRPRRQDRAPSIAIGGGMPTSEAAVGGVSSIWR